MFGHGPKGPQVALGCVLGLLGLNRDYVGDNVIPLPYQVLAHKSPFSSSPKSLPDHSI